MNGPTAAPSLLSSDTASAGYETLVIGGSRLSEGTIIHGTVRARLLGVNLLRLEATIEAAPARLTNVQHLVPTVGSFARPRAVALPGQARVVGSKLDEALGYLDEGAASLAAASRLPTPVTPEEHEG